MTKIPRIVITPGEPAGIGPDITVQVAQKNWNAELICVCDPKLLQQRAQQIGLPFNYQLFDPAKPAELHSPGVLKCIPIKLTKPCIPGKLDIDNAEYVLECLRTAADYCSVTKFSALVTGPIHKSVINDAGIIFTGHTEFLAKHFHVSHPVMLFVADNVRVALTTTHLPLAKVPQAISSHHLMNTIRILDVELKNKFAIQQPKILVCGLNPHAGEAGHLGREEIEIIEPAIKKLCAENINVIGPLPADTIFTPKHLKEADAILGMYHDQVLPIVKYMSFGHAVNVTLGLPLIRTSVDHGTALDIAGSKTADAGSLEAAMRLAINLSNYR